MRLSLNFKKGFLIMVKEKEIVLLFRDILDRTNELADAVEKNPVDIEFVKTARESYLSKYQEGLDLLSLPANEVTDNFMFKMMYGSFSETMKNLLLLVGLYYKNMVTFYGVEGEETNLKETIQDIGKFRKECNKRFKKVAAQLASIGHVD